MSGTGQLILRGPLTLAVLAAAAAPLSAIGIGIPFPGSRYGSPAGTTGLAITRRNDRLITRIGVRTAAVDQDCDSERMVVSPHPTVSPRSVRAAG
jgi:hypothetical protein